jgi:hypothetical protein
MTSTSSVEARQPSGMLIAYLEYERGANKVGLKINESKTKYMIAAETDRLIRNVEHSVVLSDKKFKVVKEFVYLGSMVTPNNDVSRNTEANPDCK